MRNKLVTVAVVVVVVGGYLTLRSRALNSRVEAEAAKAEAAKAEASLLSHDVYFTLKDQSGPAKEKLVAACKKYLAKHPGEVFFAAGTRAEDLKREVNDQDFDVALHIVFQSQADQAKYQEAPRHLKFIAENKDNWKKVRVFDSVVQR